ncbi:MAG: N-acetylglucosamine kinase-like BadF-type ATPase [Bacteroidia bacterium]|jgi:N-acetylglucosamine kinase-like BadF-type ATPase
MILVADSGSTKCDWLVINASKQVKTNTVGFNPFFHSAALIFDKISENNVLASFQHEITEVYFYGAGCSSEERNAVVKHALQQFFTNLTTISVNHDLTGAALATCGNSEGIACILGTGSNSCFFDGEKTHEAVPALGYILGDEGSGSYFGKILISKYLYKTLPEDLMVAMDEEFDINKEIIFSKVYNEPNPNVYLASFMKFISNHRDHPFFKDMIYKGLASFINTHVWCYDNFRDVPVHFVGSIAYYFKEVLNEVAKNHRFTTGNIEKRPIEPLARFHTRFTTA